MNRLRRLVLVATGISIATVAAVATIRVEAQRPAAGPPASTAAKVGPGTPDIPGVSTYKGKWVYENGFIKVPDGRKFKAPAGFEKGTLPGGPAAEANKNFDEVAAVAKEMVAEEKKKKDRQDLVVNPALIRGVQVVHPARRGVQQPKQ